MFYMTATKQNLIRVGIDGGDFVPGQKVRSGISRLVDSFVRTLHEYPETRIQWFYYHFSPKNNKTPILKFVRLPRRFFSSLFVPLALLAQRMDIYLAFSGVLPSIRIFDKKSIVFLHDFGFFDNPEKYRFPEKMKWQTEYALFAADRIVVFSDYIKKQVFERFPKIKKEKVIRIYPGADHIVDTNTVKKPDYRYFLFVGVIKPAKNIEELFLRFSMVRKMIKGANFKLVLIGSKERQYFDNLTKTKAYLENIDNIVFVEDATDDELYWYYKHCIALLNVSYEEGFCYPVVEALHLGCHVVVNDLALYKEFKSIYRTLHIMKNTDEYIVELVKLSVNNIAFNRKEVTVKAVITNKTTQLTWKNFRKDLISVINTVAS